MPNRSISGLPTFFAPSHQTDSLAADKPGVGALEVLDITYLHFHSVLELGVCVSGAGSCQVEEKKYDFSAGDVQVIFPFQSHLSRSEGGEYSRWYWMGIDPIQLLGAWGAPELPRLEQLLYTQMGICGIIDREKYPLLCQLVRRVVEPGEERLRIACLCALIEVMAAESKNLPKLRLRPGRHFTRLAPALELAAQSLGSDKPASVAQMAQACALSVAPFRRAFHLATGQSPQQYIHICRMRKAQQLLMSGMPITEIALAVGYQDASGFNRQFLKTFGMTPRDYRAHVDG